MVAIKRKKVALEGERTAKGILSFPRFYIKAVSGSFSLYHRLTHAYMGSYSTEQELESALEALAQMTEKEVWSKLMNTLGFSFPGSTAMKNKFDDEREDWYFGAWGIYTTRFYEKNPHLFTEVLSPPMDVIKSIKLEVMNEQKKQHELHRLEIERAENAYKNAPVKERPVPIAEPKPEKVERVSSIIKDEPKPKPKKIIKKVKKFTMPSI